MPVSTTILAIECACGPCSVALWQNGHILGLLEEQSPISQSARLMPMIQQILVDNKLTYPDLTHVACTVGPGSFTGIRVGLAAARGICFAAGKPGVGISTLKTTAFAAPNQSKPIVAVLRAGKGEWYWQGFSANHLNPMDEPAVAKPEAVLAAAPQDAVFAGNVATENISIVQASPRADHLAVLAATKKDALALAPLYIRSPDVTLPKKS